MVKKGRKTAPGKGKTPAPKVVPEPEEKSTKGKGKAPKTPKDVLLGDPSSEEEEEEEISDIEEPEPEGSTELSQPNPSTKAKRPKAVTLVLSMEVQEDLVDWLRDNPILYDRTRVDFKMKEKKNQLWEQKAKAMKEKDPELDITGGYKISALPPETGPICQIFRLFSGGLVSLLIAILIFSILQLQGSGSSTSGTRRCGPYTLGPRARSRARASPAPEPVI